MFLRSSRESSRASAAVLKSGWIGYVCSGLILALFAFTGCGPRLPEKPKEMVVSAAVSLIEVLEQAGTVFESRTGIKVEFEFASSGSLARKIDAGSPTDVFVSASEKWIDYLSEKNLLVPESKKLFARNELVCAVPAELQAIPAKPEELAGFQRIAIGTPDHVPAGLYAMQALTWFGMWDKLTREEKLILTIDVRAALSHVEEGQVQAGIVYRTDALSSDKVKIAFTFPEESHSPMTYYAAAVAGSRNGKAAEDFLKFLTSKDFQSILLKYNFKLPMPNAEDGR